MAGGCHLSYGVSHMRAAMALALALAQEGIGYCIAQALEVVDEGDVSISD
jgi:hypothetical protein